MKTNLILAVALALLVTEAPAQRSIFEPQIDLRTSAERAEDQRLEILRRQQETNEELRRQTWELERATFEASRERIRRQNAEDDARKAAQNAEADRVFEQRLRLQQRAEPAVTSILLLPTEQKLMDAEVAIKEIRANITFEKTVANAMVKSILFEISKPTPDKPPLTEENVLWVGAFIRGYRNNGGKNDPFIKEILTDIALHIDVKASFEKIARELQQAKPPAR